MSLRVKIASAAGEMASIASRSLKIGNGDAIGGRTALFIDGDILKVLGRNVKTVLVSGTNGKTTTNRIVYEVISKNLDSKCAYNSNGANMEAGIAYSLINSKNATYGTFEVDELYFEKIGYELNPTAVVLTNLSRDQLDRSNEVRRIAASWERFFGRNSELCVVANCQDPLIVYSLRKSKNVTWVNPGFSWYLDAKSCLICNSQIIFSNDEWACSGCDFKMPNAQIKVANKVIEIDGIKQVEVDLQIPGRCNVGNFAFSLGLAVMLGIDIEKAKDAAEGVSDVAGRYEVFSMDEVEFKFRLLLAKNPAGWQEALSMVEDSSMPVVVALNAQVADGKDPSWIYDVSFEELKNRHVICCGQRARDMGVRLYYAGLAHEVVHDFSLALKSKRLHEEVAKVAEKTGLKLSDVTVDIIANYTSFQAFRTLLGKSVSLNGK